MKLLLLNYSLIFNIISPGFLIFVFRCLFNPEAKLGWYQLLTTGTLKRRRGPIKSTYTDSSSATAHGRRSSDVTTGRVSITTTKSVLSTSGGGGKHPHPHHMYNTNNNTALNGVGGGRNEADFAPEVGGVDDDDKSLNSLYAIPEDEKMGTSPDSTTNMAAPFVEDECTHF